MIPSLKMLMLSQAVFIGVQVQHQEGTVSCIFCGGIDQCNHYFRTWYSTRIIRKAIKMYRFLHSHIQEILNEQVREGPRDLYFNQHELFEAHWSKRILKIVFSSGILLFRILCPVSGSMVSSC